MRVGERAYSGGYSGVLRAGASLSVQAGRQGAASDPAGAGANPADSLTVLGIPESELTPKIRAAVDRLIRDVKRLRLDLERAKERALHWETLADQDALTSGLNRRAFIRELSRMLAFAERYQAPSSLVYFDVDGMKRINDGFGHAAGDAALRHVATLLMENVRSFDVVGRLGGDEFAVILALVDGEGALAKARSLAKAIESRPAAWNGSGLDVRVSFGVNTFSGRECVDEALHAADRAMYKRKRTPKSSRAAA